MDPLILNRDDLPRDGSSYEFEGYLHADTDASFIWVDVAPGEGPRLHKHPYAEIFIILEGRATYTVGSATLEAEAGQILIAPPETPHKFTNSGTGRLHQIDIHLSKQFRTDWLE